MKCRYCGKEKDLRPYGPGGAQVCFKCAMETPERKKTTEDQFKAALEADGPVELFIDGENGKGPRPVKYAGGSPN